MLIFRLDRFLRGGDHYSFQSAGIFGSPTHRVPRRLSPSAPERAHGKRHRIWRSAEICGLRLRRARSPAERRDAGIFGRGPGASGQCAHLTKDLENDTTLTWEASPGEPAEYEVIWRATTSPQWEHAQDVGNATRATLKISKDNVIFAVRAVDKAGHRSLPVVPTPER